VAGFIIRDESPVASNWRADSTLRDYLVRNNVVAISDIDTRALTRVLRSAGVMRGIIATGEADHRVLIEKARGLAPMEGSDLVRGVTCDAPFDQAQDRPFDQAQDRRDNVGTRSTERSTRPRSSGCVPRSGPSRGMPTSCTTRC